jgi:hypothetical protein
MCWGLWQFIADPEAATLDVVHLRIGDMHLNALGFLEPPPLVNLTLESLEFNGNIIEADIGLRHPFLGLTEFTGFDVCGILITNGSCSGFEDADLIMAGDGDTHLKNPDGYTRWWNPAEFPADGTIFGYKDGLLGTPDSVGNYNSTINAYKYFCDDLVNPDDPLDKVTPEKRGMFGAGQKNIRHYTIEIGAGGLIFNYAVDANWEFPGGDPPWKAPDSFGPGANRVEAWRISVTETKNTLWNDGVDLGGDLTLLIDVYDWFDAELNTVYVESPGNFDAAGPIGPSGGGPGYSTYEIEIIDATPQNSGTIDLLITAECEAVGYQQLLPGKPVAAYLVHSVHVSEEPQECELKNIDVTNEGHYASDFAIDHTNGDILVYYRDGDVRRYFFDDCYETFETYECFWASEENLGQQNPSKYYREMGDFIDVGDNGYFMLGIHRRYDTATPQWNDNQVWAYFYTSDGTEVTHQHAQTIQWGGWQTHVFDAQAFVSSAGPRAGDMGFCWEYGSGGVRDNRHVTWPDPDFTGFTNCIEGSTGLTGYPVIPFIGYAHMGSETNKDNSYVWLVSRQHTVAWLWDLQPGTYNHNCYVEVGPRFGTESPQLSIFQNATENDDGLYYAMDITRDNENTMYILDRLGADPGPYNFVIKGFTFTISPPATTPLGHFGSSDDWDLTPKRIEGSDFNGWIAVLHTDDDNDLAMVSLFTEDEIPW